MKILEALQSLTAKQVVWIVIAIVVLSPGIKAGIGLIAQGLGVLEGALK